MRMTRTRLCLTAVFFAALPLFAQQSPTGEKGFHPDKMYDFSAIDHVNTFGGDVVVTIPIGMRYPLDGGLTYGLTLTQ
ncbi:MAG TPA: hypothetical protein VN181_09225, partial [Thermoanaerobaculia bacterium]|nr:hypothetical protein [Thermoanaerobaculia bacterium]